MVKIKRGLELLVGSLVFIAERMLWIDVGSRAPEKAHQRVCMPGRAWRVFAWWGEAGAGVRDVTERSRCLRLCLHAFQLKSEALLWTAKGLLASGLNDSSRAFKHQTPVCKTLLPVNCHWGRGDLWVVRPSGGSDVLISVCELICWVSSCAYLAHENGGLMQRVRLLEIMTPNHPVCF